MINSFHGSDGPVSAAREINFIFGSEHNYTELPLPSPSEKGLDQKTLVILKPDVSDKLEEVITKILHRGYKVQKREELKLTTEKASEMLKLLNSQKRKVNIVADEDGNETVEDIPLTQEEQAAFDEEVAFLARYIYYYLF